MTELEFFNVLTWAWIGVALLTVPYLVFVAAPYGRHARPGWGPTVGPRLGWVLMESPAVLLVGGFFVAGGDYSAPKCIFLGMWMLHYLQRTFVFPMLMKPGARMPLAIVMSGFFFNLVNGYMQGRWLFHFAPAYPMAWFTSPTFIIGAALFLSGYALNLHSDRVLRNLRKPGEKGYKIPRGGLFRFVSAPNYLAEIVEWTGWAIATWSMPGLVFVIWTTANLAPRAFKNHQWYRDTFPDYPKVRKALIPFIV